MKLGLWYVPGTAEDERRACALAAGVLAKAGVSAEDGYAALLRASSGEGLPEDADMIVAWYDAEAAALVYLFDVTGIWPEQGALIVVS
jgi:hypothetical protein